MKTFAEVEDWVAGAYRLYGDPSVPVCQLFFRWVDDLTAVGEDLVAGLVDGELVLLLGPEFPPFPMRVANGRLQMNERGELVAYGAAKIIPGVWALKPSLNAPGLIHGFVVLHGVPDPAPWESVIVVPGRMRW